MIDTLQMCSGISIEGVGESQAAISWFIQLYHKKSYIYIYTIT